MMLPAFFFATLAALRPMHTGEGVTLGRRDVGELWATAEEEEEGTLVSAKLARLAIHEGAGDRAENIVSSNAAGRLKSYSDKAGAGEKESASEKKSAHPTAPDAPVASVLVAVPMAKSPTCTRG